MVGQRWQGWRGRFPPATTPTPSIVHVDLVGTAHILDAFARVVAPGGAGIVVVRTGELTL